MIRNKTKLKIDSCYSDYEIIDMKMQALNGHNMDYLTYEKDAKVYFFERIDKNLLRLFCCTSKKSFYLKKSIS